MSRSNEAFFWSLFSAGGVASALFLPAIILATGFLLPTEDVVLAADRTQHLHSLVSHWLTKVVLIGIFFVTAMHCAHRIQHTSKDLGLRPIGGAIALLCYLAALAMTICCGLMLWNI